jgi:hypothetical protein
MKNFIWKDSAGEHPLKKFPSDHDNMVTRDAGAGKVQTIKNFFLKTVKGIYFSSKLKMTIWTIFSVFV